MKNQSKKSSQILEASVLGTIAFNNGIKRVPHFDLELSKMFKGRFIGITPKGEASSINIMKAWLQGWDAANLSKAWSVGNELSKCN